jgi:hypothetical protein
MKTKKNFQILILSFVILSFLVVPRYNLLAQEGEDIEWTAAEQAALKQIDFAEQAGLYNGQSLPNRIIGIINIALTLVGLLFLVMIIISGFQWMTSGGNEELISKAKKRLIGAIIGLAIVLGAWIISNTLMLLIQGEPIVDGNLWEPTI